jgi:hypothetical protein
MTTRQVLALLPEGSSFAVTWFDVPGATDRPAANEVLLNALADQRARTGRLLSQRSITLDGYPGRELRLEMTTRHGTALLISRDYLIGGRLYQVMAEVPRTYATQRTGEVVKFFDSFRPTRGR